MSQPQNKNSLPRTVAGILFPSVRSAFRPLTRTITDEARDARDLVLRAAGPTRPDPRLLRIDDRRERFNAALFLSGRAERDLPAIEAHAGRIFETYALLTMAAFLWLVAAPALGLAGQSGWRLADLAFPVGAVVLLAAKAFSWSVTLYRIQRRSMVTVREFLRDPNAWLGGKPRLGGTVLSVAVGLGLGWLLPGPALAADAAIVTANTVQGAGSALMSLVTNAGAEDLSLEWLRRLFPGMANLACPAAGTVSCAASDADTLGAMAGAFNSVLCGLSAFVMAWHTIVGTVATAHEGKVMGQRWHTLWAPIRVVMGFGLLVPIKGYCGAQFAMLMVIVMGYNMANGLWSAYVDKALSGEMAAVAVSSTPNMGLDLAHSVLASETCVSVLNAYRAQLESQNRGALARLGSLLGLRDTGVPEAATPDPSGRTIPATDGATQLSPTVIWDYGAACGVVRANYANQPPANEFGSWVGGAVNASNTANGLGANTTSVTSAFANTSNDAYRTFLQARTQAVSTLITAVRATGLSNAVRDAVSNGVPGGAGGFGTALAGSDLMTKYLAVRQAGVDFDTAINTAATAMVTTLNSAGGAQFKARAQALGWASAGALNSTLVRATARAAELVSQAAPNATIPDLVALQRVADNARDTEGRQRLQRGFQYLGDLVRDFDQRGSASPNSVSLGADMQGRNVIAQLVKPFSELLTQAMVGRNGFATLDPTHPMADIQALGNNMLTGAWGMLAGWLVLKGGGGAAAGSFITSTFGGGAIAGVLEGIAPLAWTAMGAMFICGILHAYILPMLPFLLWFYAIISVVSLAAELVLAAAVAAFMHIRADGQELINTEQKAIWVMGFNALLRPSLLLLGLVVSNLVLSIGANFLNRMYGVAVTTTNGDSVVGFAGLITLTVLAFYMHYQIVVRSMHLITAVPAIVSQIVGASDQHRGEHEEGNKVFAAIGNLSRSGVNATSQGLMRGMEPKPPPNEPQVNAPPGDGGGGSGGGSVKPAPTGRGRGAAESTATAAGAGGNDRGGVGV